MNRQRVAIAKVCAVSVVSQGVSLIVGYKINQALDGYLAKAENPGKFNRFMRWNFKLGRNPYWIASVITLQSLAVAAKAAKVLPMIGELQAGSETRMPQSL